MSADGARSSSGGPSPSVPLDGEILLRWAGSLAVGATLVVAGWYLASGEPSLNDQVGPINLAVAGLAVAAVGHANLIRQMRSRLGERRAIVLSHLLVSYAAPAVAVEVKQDARLVALADGRYFHRSTCALVAGRAVASASRDDHARCGRAPCGVCSP
jgi:hypothetical protein